jgi:hypothetical protein
MSIQYALHKKLLSCSLLDISQEPGYSTPPRPGTPTLEKGVLSPSGTQHPFLWSGRSNRSSSSSLFGGSFRGLSFGSPDSLERKRPSDYDTEGAAQATKLSKLESKDHEIEDLQHQLKWSQERVDSLNDTLSIVTKEKDGFFRQLSQANQSNHQLQLQLLKMQGEISQIKSKLTEAEKNVLKLESKLTKTQKAHEEGKKINDRLKEDLSQKRAQNLKLSDEKLVLLQEKDRLEVGIEELQSKASSDRRKIEGLRQTASSQAQQLSRLSDPPPAYRPQGTHMATQTDPQEEPAERPGGEPASGSSGRRWSLFGGKKVAPK